MAPTRVAVIGGGPLGLMALKNFKEDGFEATLFETRPYVGGLWKYSTDSTLSATEDTAFNSSKYRTAITDFPVPDEGMEDFPPAAQLHAYLEGYCERFGLWEHIRLNSRVEAVRRVGERWEVEVAGKEGEESRREYFEKVAISSGPFTQPRQPEFVGIDRFQGQALHVVNFHNPERCKGQNVLVIGLHASAQDLVTSLSRHAKKVYLSHRSGCRFISRYANDDSVYDRTPGLGMWLILLYLSALVPSFHTWFMDKAIAKISKKMFPNVRPEWGLDPAPSLAVAAPLIASQIYPHLESGFCEPVPEVSRIIGPRTVELKSGRLLSDIDTIVYCTGYHSSIPVKMEPPELNPYPYPGSPARLYRLTFPLHPDPAIRNSLAFLGQVALHAPGFAPHELVSLSVSQIWQGKSSLPPFPEMQKWHRNFLAWREHTSKKYNAQSSFFTVFVPAADHASWLDETAGAGIRAHFGLLSRWTNWETWKMWWNEPKLYKLCLTGLISPAIFRLFETGKRKAWDGAAKQIFIDNERVQKAQERRKKEIEKLGKIE